VGSAFKARNDVLQIQAAGSQFFNTRKLKFDGNSTLKE